MEIFPAIDIRDGKVVRLTEGDFTQVSVYGDSPLDTAVAFMSQGARNLHVVDLDGAKNGHSGNYAVIRAVCGCKELFIEVGGGIRDRTAIERYAEIGVRRVILGTVAARDFPFVAEAVRDYKELIAVGVDARDGKVAVHGWQDVTGIDSMEFCERLRDTGVSTVIYTDIARDGRLAGANIEVYRDLRRIEGLDIVASGGISYEHEIAELRDMGTYASILGKALYEGKLLLSRAIEIADNSTL